MTPGHRVLWKNRGVWGQEMAGDMTVPVRERFLVIDAEA
jgi:hypothetical protein